MDVFAIGQLSVEMVVISAAMIMLLLAIYLLNNDLQLAWSEQKGSLDASNAANGLALAMNKAAAGGNGTIVAFPNLVGPEVTSMSIYNLRVVRAYHSSGGFSSAPLVTNKTNVSGSIPLNQELFVRNSEGWISVGVS